MVKKVIKISKGGAPAAAVPVEQFTPLKAPRTPVRLNTAPAAQPAPAPAPQKRILTAASRAAPAEPQKRIITAASKQRTASPPQPAQPATPAQYRAVQRKKEAASGPPLWLIPVGLIGLITIIVIIVSVSSNSKRDPYFDNNTTKYKERGPYVDPNANKPRPMREYMKEHGPSEMAKEREARMRNRGTPPANNSGNN